MAQESKFPSVNDSKRLSHWSDKLFHLEPKSENATPRHNSKATLISRAVVHAISPLTNKNGGYLLGITLQFEHFPNCQRGNIFLRMFCIIQLFLSFLLQTIERFLLNPIALSYRFIVCIKTPVALVSTVDFSPQFRYPRHNRTYT